MAIVVVQFTRHWEDGTVIINRENFTASLAVYVHILFHVLFHILFHIQFHIQFHILSSEFFIGVHVIPLSSSWLHHLGPIKGVRSTPFEPRMTDWPMITELIDVKLAMGCSKLERHRNAAAGTSESAVPLSWYWVKMIFIYIYPMIIIINIIRSHCLQCFIWLPLVANWWFGFLPSTEGQPDSGDDSFVSTDVNMNNPFTLIVDTLIIMDIPPGPPGSRIVWVFLGDHWRWIGLVEIRLNPLISRMRKAQFPQHCPRTNPINFNYLPQSDCTIKGDIWGGYV